jgi:hypothetical protein
VSAIAPAIQTNRTADLVRTENEASDSMWLAERGVVARGANAGSLI